MYQGIVESIRDETDITCRRVILPSTFIGSPRSMIQLYQDSMVIVGKCGPPSLFITMTANPCWPEITNMLLPGQVLSDWPDLGTRVFHLKLKLLLHDLLVNQWLGEVAGFVYSIEFQKRGLPHCHLMLMMSPSSVPQTPAAVDCIVCADFPDPVTEPQLHRIVAKNMVHGPCSKGTGCWLDGSCSKKFPKPFTDATTLIKNSYPHYRRRDAGQFVVKGGQKLTNQYVVPYNKFLCLKFDCHINVEIPYGITATKYLFKYITKGHNRSAMKLSNKNHKILQYVNGHYIGPCEGMALVASQVIKY